ncbi:hypothetical protein V2J09_023542, partial [Rumex salicifolius]
ATTDTLHKCIEIPLFEIAISDITTPCNSSAISGFAARLSFPDFLSIGGDFLQLKALRCAALRCVDLLAAVRRIPHFLGFRFGSRRSPFKLGIMVKWVPESVMLHSLQDYSQVHANAAEMLCAIARYAPPALAAKVSSPKMDGREGKSNDDTNIQLGQIFVEFLTEVTRFEHLVSAGLKFLNGFQHGLQLLRQNPTNETSKLVKSIIEENENKTLRSYIEAGWTKRQYRVSHMFEMNTCFEGLKDVIRQGELMMGELERLMDNAGCALKMIPKSSSDIDECEEDGSMSSERVDATEYASFMAVIYGMVNQDYLMQEKIVSSLDVMTSIEELGSYCLMWSLRPFVDDAVINRALEYIA